MRDKLDSLGWPLLWNGEALNLRGKPAPARHAFRKPTLAPIFLTAGFVLAPLPTLTYALPSVSRTLQEWAFNCCWPLAACCIILGFFAWRRGQ